MPGLRLRRARRVLERKREYLDRGGDCIIPLPEVRVTGPEVRTSVGPSSIG